jgi:hypothetical protein
MATLIEQHNALVARYTELVQDLLTAREAGKDTATLVSLSGKLGTPKMQIENLEVEMELEGVEYTPWVQPVVPGTHRKVSARNTQELKTRLAKLEGLRDTTDKPGVKASAERQITALKKQLGL